MSQTITFDLASGELSWGSKTWSAVSGPQGDGALDPGTYRLERRLVTSHTTNIDEPFKDKATGKGFFVPLTPQFKTKRGTQGGRLGIHPDGNVPGTEGCIGITSDSGSFYRMIANTKPSAIIYVEVK